MKQFQKNVLRLASQNKGSFLGAVFIIAIGIFVYVAMMDTLKNLKGQVEAYYEESALADVFAEVSGISETELSGILTIPGIAAVSGKIAADVRLMGAGQEEIVTVHLLSYEESDTINLLALSAPLKDEESLFLGGRMAAEYGYEPGEPLKLIFEGEAVDFTYQGTCHEADYIYSIPPGGAMVPDGAVYDIACISRARMEELTGKRGSLNELGFRLADGYEFEDVRSALAERLRASGLLSLTARKDQTSYNMVDGEMGELISVGTILPVLFLAISAFMLYVVLKKMIDRDRSLIGTMKAFGMTDRELMSAYLFEGAVIGAAGAILGSILAVPFGQYMFDMYVDFFNLPDTVYHSYAWSRVSGLLLSVGTGLLAVWLGVRDILAIVPAQAMRAKPPKSAGTVQIPDFLGKHLGPLMRMGVRSMARSPFRGFLIALAVAFPFAMISVLYCFDGVADQMFMDQFEKVQIYDLQASLDTYVSPLRAKQAGEEMDGVAEAEAVLAAPVEFRNENLSEFAMLYGLNEGSRLWRIMDNRGNFFEPPEKGVILNSRTAGKLHAAQGDVITVTVSGMTTEEVAVPVAAVIEESLGSGCYISLEAVDRLFQTAPAANTVIVKTEEGAMETVKEKLRETSHVSWLSDARKILESYREMMGSMTAMIHMFSAFSLAAGCVLIYNISIINIRERESELGTLMILGETNRELGQMLFWEQAVYFAAGILLGIPGSFSIRYLIEKLIVSESYTIHMDVGPDAYTAAFLACLGITLISWAAQLKVVGKIRLTDILKG